MLKNEDSKKYDLEERTLKFAKEARNFAKTVKWSIANNEDIKQFVRASGSVGANYIEANESLSKKDFLFRIKVCRKEAKECIYWLELLNTDQEKQLQNEKEKLIQEATELMMIFGSIVRKTKID